MNYMALCANISTLLGLLGTIAGLIQSFAAVASADPSSKAKLLALGISKAMNTTAFGLIAAISLMVIHSVLTSKGEKIVADIDEQSLKLVDLLAAKNGHMYVAQHATQNSEIHAQQHTDLPPPPLKEVA
jgi:biopolymer transport protein ExbB/TolQ